MIRVVADQETVSSSSGLQTVGDAAKHGLRFVARQPILNREQQVFAYELLFRDGVENFLRASDAEAAARSTLDSSLLMGFDVLCDGQRAVINLHAGLAAKGRNHAAPCRADGGGSP